MKQGVDQNPKKVKSGGEILYSFNDPDWGIHVNDTIEVQGQKVRVGGFVVRVRGGRSLCRIFKANE